MRRSGVRLPSAPPSFAQTDEGSPSEGGLACAQPSELRMAGQSGTKNQGFQTNRYSTLTSLRISPIQHSSIEGTHLISGHDWLSAMRKFARGSSFGSSRGILSHGPIDPTLASRSDG